MTLFERATDLEQPDMFMTSISGYHMKRWKVEDAIITNEEYGIQKTEHNYVWGKIKYSVKLDDNTSRDTAINLVVKEPYQIMVASEHIKFDEKRIFNILPYPITLYLEHIVGAGLLNSFEEQMEEKAYWSSSFNIQDNVKEILKDAIWKGVVEYVRWQNEHTV